jgi:hypothetical protein
MRARFERFARVSREALQRKFPTLVFQDHNIDGLAIESVCAVETPARVALYLHGGVFFMGSPAMPSCEVTVRNSVVGRLSTGV